MVAVTGSIARSAPKFFWSRGRVVPPD